MTVKVTNTEVFAPPLKFAEKANITSYPYIADPDSFWLKRATTELDWFRKPTKSLDVSNAPFYKYFEDGVLNVSTNCIDRHLVPNGTKPAIIWEGEPGDTKVLTYSTLYREVNNFANSLKSLGVKKGDRVALYMPMVPELPVAMLACARIGAIHSVIFGGFSSNSLQQRLEDAQAKVLVTIDSYFRNGKEIRALDNVFSALDRKCESVSHVVVVNRRKENIAKTTFPKTRSYYGPVYRWWHDLMSNTNDYCLPAEMSAEDPLFLLYTSGSTGKPKGIVHTCGGYSLYTHMTYKWIFDYKEDDVFWCTADIGWITGHSYVVYGPLSNGGTVFMFEGVPTYPDPGKWWELVDKYNISVFYTAPTVIRSLIQQGRKWPEKYKLDSLRLLGSVGEPINPDAWMWYHKYIGKEQCPIVDTWWQTETGGVLISPLSGITSTKPGSATLPFPGIEPMIVDSNGKACGPGVLGNLVIARPWPGMLRTIWKDDVRYCNTYYPKEIGGNLYLSGDEALQDKDGYFWVFGRNDDVINVSGHRLGSAEIEHALVSHPDVSEAAVIGVPHELKGWTPYCFVTLNDDSKNSEGPDLRKELVKQIRTVIGPIATPEAIQFCEEVPKTRSGKIMRRLLRKIAVANLQNTLKEELMADLGDITTLVNPESIEKLIINK